MPYVEEVCRCGSVIEVDKYYSYRWHAPGQQRQEKAKPSTEGQKKRNQRRAEKKLRRLMNANFSDGDYLIRFDFVNRPGGSEEMQPYIQKAIRALRGSFRKIGKELRYIYVKEVGPKGGRHIHIIMNRCSAEIIRKSWPYGGIHIDPLYSGGQYRKIAAYFVKYAERTEKTEGQLIGKRWYGSRNLIKPKITRKVVPAKKFRRNIKQIAGYTLDKDTEVYGISDVTGYEFFSYQLVKVGEECRELISTRGPT